LSPTQEQLDDQLSVAADACSRKLKEDSLAKVVGQLGQYGQPETAFRLLTPISWNPDPEVSRVCAAVTAEPGLAEQALLLLASQYAIPRVPALPVTSLIKRLFAEEFQFFANPSPVWAPQMRSDNVRYLEMARVATLRRFPAGQFQWETGAFPRSWLKQAEQPWKVLAYVLGKMRGFGPLLELHVNERRKNRLILLEKEANISYYRVARCLDQQPAVKGIVLTSWLFCESTARITPRLAWLRETPLSAGAMIAELGPAPEDSGFLKGSDERRSLYEQGVYRPKDTCVLWPRKLLLEWAGRHPEFDL
jgi:hypothetical protein